MRYRHRHRYRLALKRNLLIELLETRCVLSADLYEPNNSPSEVNAAPLGGTNSPNLGPILNTRSIGQLNLDDAADWYSFKIQDWGTSHDRVAIDFVHNQGDLDLELYAADGTSRLRSSNSFSNGESISLAGQSPGTYFVKVFGRSGAMNPSYSLTIDPPGNSPDDSLEPNDSITEVSDRTAGIGSPNLGTLVGLHSYQNLKLEDQVDWYRFETTDWGTSHQYVSIDFVHTNGDLNLDLYAADGTTRVKSSAGFGNGELLTLAELQPATYFIKVTGRSGDANAAYALHVHAPGTETDDAFESNDSPTQVSGLPTGIDSPNLGIVEGDLQLPGLHLEDQSDWYRFETSDWGTSRHHISIDFLHSEGDLNLDLFAADGTTRLSTSGGFSDGETVSLAGFAPGIYYARVFGRNGDANAHYGLRVLAPGTIPDDGVEPNDSPALVDAFPVSLSGTTPNLGTLYANVDVPKLKLEDQVDWFRFTTTDWGTSHDYVQILFSDAAGDLELELYNSTGQIRLRQSGSFSDNEAISLAGLEPNTYYVKIFGRNGDANNDYTLTIDPPGNSVDDGYEPNDNVSVVLNSVPGGVGSPLLAPNTGNNILINGLRLEDEVDYFAFDLPNFGRASDRIVLEFLDSQGDLNLSLLHPDGTILAGSSGFVNNEAISLEDFTPGRYLVAVSGRNGDGNSSYSLRIDLPTAPPVVRDFVARDISLLTNTAGWLRPGQSAAVQLALLDAGGVGGATNYQVVLSSDALPDGGDTVLASGSATLIEGTIKLISQSIAIPSSFADGSYFLILKTDSSNVVAETDERNNAFVSPVHVYHNRPQLILSKRQIGQ